MRTILKHVLSLFQAISEETTVTSNFWSCLFSIECNYMVIIGLDRIEFSWSNEIMWIRKKDCGIFFTLILQLMTKKNSFAPSSMKYKNIPSMITQDSHQHWHQKWRKQTSFDLETLYLSCPQNNTQQSIQYRGAKNS